MTLTYFAYGSNMLTERLRRRVPSTLALGHAVLEGWTMTFQKRGNDGSAKCTIVQADGECHGVLFTISADERGILDRIEGLGVGYEIREIAVRYGSQIQSAFTYVAQDDWVEEGLTPFDWYHKLVALGARQHDLPEDYQNWLSTIEVRTDSPAPHRSEAEAVFAELMWLKD